MITVVSICLNNENDIEKTIDSVVRQENVEIEYIIKDGCSKDKTNKIISNYIKACKNSKIHFKHIISADTGIYDAMNQAMEIASGDWIIFMNAGDYFYDSRVLKCVNGYLELGADIFYGNTLYLMNKKYIFPQIHYISKMDKKFSLGHQSCFIKTELVKKYKFDLFYKIAGDYDQLKRLFDDEHRFMHMNMFVAVCNREGVSCQRTKLQFDEVYRIQHRNQSAKGFKYKKNLLIWKIKGRLIKLFPRWEIYRYCKNNMKRKNYGFD